jgi:hypothetical protein
MRFMSMACVFYHMRDADVKYVALMGTRWTLIMRPPQVLEEADSRLREPAVKVAANAVVRVEYQPIWLYSAPAHEPS